MGLRFRKDFRVLTGDRVVRPDIVFTKARLAVFVDGCFWHRCPVHGRLPKSNRGYWVPKFERNLERDRRNNEDLAASGWIVLRFFEHVPALEAAEAIHEKLRCKDY